MNNPRDAILSELLPSVPFDGWSEYALREAGKRAKAEPEKVFPEGISQAIGYFFARNDEQLKTHFTLHPLNHLRVPERIEALILKKLQSFQQNREAVRRAVSHRMMPWNTGASLTSLSHSVDGMWRLAGDQSTDFSFYTKRMTLAALYSSTLIYWLQDESADYADTHAFLTRRLSDIGAFGKWKSDWKKKLAV